MPAERVPGRISEQYLNQTSHKPQDAISLGKKIVKVTIKCMQSSGANLFIGWNTKATSGNFLEPGESATYHEEGVYLDGERLYLAFDPNGSDGLALVSIISEKQDLKCLP